MSTKQEPTVQVKPPRIALTPEILDHATGMCARSRSPLAKSFHLFPKKQKTALTLLFAFCSEVEAWADDVELGSAESRYAVLSSMRDELKGLLHDPLKVVSSNFETVRGTVYLIQTYEIPEKLFVDFIEGGLAHITNQPFMTFNELETYCYNSTSTLALMCTYFFTRRPDPFVSFLMNQGIALKLLALQNKFENDLTHGRCYLPAEWIRANPSDISHLMKLPQEKRRETLEYQRMVAALHHFSDEANRFFEQASEALKKQKNMALWPMVLIGFVSMHVIRELPRVEGLLKPLWNYIPKKVSRKVSRLNNWRLGE